MKYEFVSGRLTIIAEDHMETLRLANLAGQLSIMNPKERTFCCFPLEAYKCLSKPEPITARQWFFVFVLVLATAILGYGILGLGPKF